MSRTRASIGWLVASVPVLGALLGCRGLGEAPSTSVGLVAASDAALAPDEGSPTEPADETPLTRQEVLDLLAARDRTGDGGVPLLSSVPLEASGGIFLWHYQPLLDGADPNTQIYWAYLRLDADLPGDVDFHLETMFRDTNLRPFFNSNVWIQEAYLAWKPANGANGQLKAGKIYSRFGRFWDGTFYGNAPYFDGLKLDPDLGLSYEHTFECEEGTEIETSLQYFPRDGSTNGSLQGRDTLSYPGGVQRDSFVLRVAPTRAVAEDVLLTVGLSGQAFEADFANDSLDDQVTRWAAEGSLTVQDLTVFGEVARQNGTHAPNYPLVGGNESNIVWVMSGVDFAPAERWQLGYRFSLGEYEDTAVRETFHMPRIQYQVTENVAIWLEYVKWDQDGPGSTLLDDSVNLVLYAYF